MRRRDKDKLLEYLHDMAELQEQLQEKDIDSAVLVNALQQLQNAGYQVGTAIEESEGEGTRTVSLLEDYCEMLYRCSEKAGSSWNGRKEDLDKLDRELEIIRNSLKQDIPTRTEVVFLSYRASRWKDMEELWKQVQQYADCHVVVMPIPYFDKNPDGSLGKQYDEENLLPDTVETVSYKEYHLQEERPDILFFQNPCDRDNKTISVAPEFNTDRMKQYVNCLVCILDEEQKNKPDIIRTTGMFNADLIFVSSERTRNTVIKNLTELTGPETEAYWKDKIQIVGPTEAVRVLGIL